MANVIVVKGSGIKYASSVASSTVNTALTEDQLATGAVGIYGIQRRAGSVNDGKPVLIENVASVAAGAEPAQQVAAADYRGERIRIVVGTTTLPVNSPDLQVVGISRVAGKVYTAPVFQVVYIGWNGTTGNMNLPATINTNDEGLIKSVQTLTGFNYRQRHTYSTGALVPTNTIYQILRKVAIQINLGDPGLQEIPLQGDVFSDGTRTAFVNNANVVNGSPLVNETAHALVAGNFVKFLGALYQVVSVTDANNYVIDAPYAGATGTVLATDANSGSYAAIANYGIRLTSLLGVNRNYQFAVDGVFIGATITYAIGDTPGSGTAEHVLRLENVEAPYRGDIDTYSAIMKHVQRLTDPTKLYDLYFITYVLSAGDKTGIKDDTETLGYLVVAFEQDTVTVGLNETDFEDIMQTLLETNTGAAAGTIVDQIH